MQRREEAGLTADKAGLTAKTFVVNWDNDGVMCLRWLHEVLRSSSEIIKGTIGS